MLLQFGQLKDLCRNSTASTQRTCDLLCAMLARDRRSYQFEKVNLAYWTPSILMHQKHIGEFFKRSNGLWNIQQILSKVRIFVKIFSFFQIFQYTEPMSIKGLCGSRSSVHLTSTQKCSILLTMRNHKMIQMVSSTDSVILLGTLKDVTKDPTRPFILLFRSRERLLAIVLLSPQELEIISDMGAPERYKNLLSAHTDGGRTRHTVHTTQVFWFDYLVGFNLFKIF